MSNKNRRLYFLLSVLLFFREKHLVYHLYPANTGVHLPMTILEDVATKENGVVIISPFNSSALMAIYRADCSA